MVILLSSFKLDSEQDEERINVNIISKGIPNGLKILIFNTYLP